MTGYEKLKILCETTFEEYPTASIELWVRELVSEHEALLNKPSELLAYFESEEMYKDY